MPPAPSVQATPPAPGVTPTTTLPAEGTVAVPSAAAAIAPANNGRGGSGIQGRIEGNKTFTDGPNNGTTPSGKTDGESELVPGITVKKTGTTPATPQAGQSAGTVAGTTDLPALQDLAPRGNDGPPQNNAQTTNQNVAAPTTFGSELKLAGDLSPSTETAATRNAPNAAASQVAVQISRAVQDGQDKFVVNLKPGTLGKVSVQLELGHDNRIIAVITAERPETLELLQRDSRALELALKDAGLKTDSGSLSFGLQGDGTKDSPFDSQSGSDSAIAVHQGGDELDTLPTQNLRAYATDASGVDMHV